MIPNIRWRSMAILALLLLLPPSARADDAVQFTVHTDNDRWPAWSPDGSTIAYTRDNGFSSNLYLQDVNGGEPRISVPTSTNVIHPTWTQDGSGIIFSRLGVLWYSGYPAPGSVTQVSSPLDGGDPDEAPAVSSAGIIAVQTIIRNETDFSIAYYARAGGTTERLTTDSGPHLWPTWNPAGTEIAFSAGGDIRSIPLAGGSVSLLEGNAANDTHPAWSPDGSRIAFASNRAGNYDIWLIPAGGGAAVQVTDDAASDVYPTWSPDGTRIAFESTRSGNPDIWIIDVGSVPVRATTWGAIKVRFHD